jgi:integrase/recombinase XerD
MSPLGEGLGDYLALRRTLGYKLERAGTELADFVAYSESVHSTHVRTKVALEWAMRTSTAESRWRADRLAMVRGLARYLNAIDPAHEIPPTGLIPARRDRPAPFLYSDEQISTLMSASRQLRSPIQAATLETVIGLLAVTGLRVAEVIRLDDADLESNDQAVLDVRHSKGGKSRLVPIESSVADAVASYVALRDRTFPRRPSSSLFVSTVGRRLRSGNLGAAFRCVVAMTELGTRPVGRAPRLGDFRHSFAMRTLLEWHQDGRDVNALLPRLSTYLGHVSPASTYWYLSASPELLAAAAGRLEVVSEVER